MFPLWKYEVNLFITMHMKKATLFLAIILLSSATFAQSNTTEALQKQFSDSKVFFFYNNTLRMINQVEDKAFDELIKDIEKMKFLMIDKPSSYSKADYKKLVTSYKGEKFEEAMTSRYQGKNFDVFMKESGGKTKGVIVLINDSTSLYVLDIVGSVALGKVTSLYKAMDESSDIGAAIEKFSHQHNSKGKKDDDDDDNDK
jgi:hypothetical protein